MFQFINDIGTGACGDHQGAARQFDFFSGILVFGPYLFDGAVAVSNGLDGRNSLNKVNSFFQRLGDFLMIEAISRGFLDRAPIDHGDTAPAPNELDQIGFSPFFCGSLLFGDHCLAMVDVSLVDLLFFSHQSFEIGFQPAF